MSKTLTQLVKEGNLKELKKVLSKKKGKAKQGDLNLEQGLETVDRRGQNLLHQGVEANQLDVVRYLIEGHSMDPNVQDKSKWTPLHVACSAGNFEIAEYLVLRVMVDVNVASVDSSTPLHYFVRHLPPNTQDTKKKETQAGPLDFRKNTNRLMRRLKPEEDPSLGMQESSYFRVLEMLLGKRGKDSNINLRNKNGDTPLHIAATRGNSLVVQFLIQHNANLNVTNKCVSPAVFFGVSLALMHSRSYGETALHLAVRAGKEQAVSLLLSSGIDPAIAGNSGTARDIAAKDDFKNILALLDRNPSSNPSTSGIGTPTGITATPRTSSERDEQLLSSPLHKPLSLQQSKSRHRRRMIDRRR